MRVSKKYGFTFLCMPKCASTSIERALRPYSQLNSNQDIKMKHTNYRNYNKYIKPCVGKKLEIVCLMREPVLWLYSWYKYRKRDEIKNKNKSTANISFSEFCEAYLLTNPPIYASMGKQSDFFKDNDGKQGVIKIFKYENLEEIKKYFEEKIGKKLEIPLLNISPKDNYDLDTVLEQRLKDFLKIDYEIYKALK